MSDQMTVGVGAGAAHLGVDRVVDLGPLHPAAHGAYRLRLAVSGPADDPVITSATPLVGHLHRGAEKLFEVRDYRQILALANRHDWLAAFCNEMAVAMAVERMLGMTVPDRASWLRTAFCELNRALALVVFLAPVAEAGGRGPRHVAARDGLVRARESVQRVLEEAAGGRIHFMANRVGGLREDVPAGWRDGVRAALDVVARGLDAARSVTVSDGDFRHRHRGLGVLTTGAALRLGVTGPAGRAAGVDLDLRRDDPGPAHAELGVTPRLGTRGDALDRVECMLDDADQALRLVRSCLDRLPPGPVNLRLPKAVKPPEGSVYVWTEAPLGVTGVHLVSRGDRTPWRLKLRTPSFNNVQALSPLLVGCRVADLPTVLASFAVVVGDIDR
ncbi:NADH-quinone oxidoreductase subunit D [Actinoalloteichus caeruleus]|nr:NADH-quinone oxidoreductase subunit D [Actinoalloteichus caeruleus]